MEEININSPSVLNNLTLKTIEEKKKIVLEKVYKRMKLSSMDGFYGLIDMTCRYKNFVTTSLEEKGYKIIHRGKYFDICWFNENEKIQYDKMEKM